MTNMRSILNFMPFFYDNWKHFNQQWQKFLHYLCYNRTTIFTGIGFLPRRIRIIFSFIFHSRNFHDSALVSTFFPVRFLYIFLFCGLLSGLFSGCYTAEFQPHAEYPGRKLSNLSTSEIEIVSRPGPFDRELGVLIIRNYTGDPHSSEFRRYIIRQAKKHGANVAVISRISRDRRNLMHTDAMDSRGNRQSTGGFESTVYSIRISFYAAGTVERNQSENEEEN